MKQRYVYALLLTTVLFLASNLQAQNMVLRLQGGTDQTILLSNLQKITFSNNNMVLNYMTGNTQAYGLSSLEKLFFSTYTTFKNTKISQANILFNPSDNQIHFRNLAEGHYPVSVFRTDGATVFSTTITNNESIDISGLPSNIYLVHINNQSLKFKK
ncbi:MAG: T9SS type A sorting domain-containing protein [Bacteroidia bacterium]|nr:T9SS type A sorting domain-containing protein [Bacteroidia bacterium]